MIFYKLHEGENTLIWQMVVKQYDSLKRKVEHTFGLHFQKQSSSFCLAGKLASKPGP
jgi:hypothetical protein